MARPWLEIGRYGSVGIELVLTILILAGLGQWIDGRYLGGHGWGAVVGFVLGAAVGFRNLARTGRQMQRDIERAEARDPDAGRWTVDPRWLHPDGRDAGTEPRDERAPSPPDTGRPPRERDGG